MIDKPRSGINKVNNNYKNQGTNPRQVSKTGVSPQSANRGDYKVQNGYAEKNKKSSGILSFFKKKGPTVEITRYKSEVDHIFLILVIVMLSLGTIMIASASYANAQQYYGDSYFFVKKQALMVFIGLIGMIVMSYIADYVLLEKFAPIIFIGTLVLNYLTPFFGKITNGAPRWFRVPFVGQIQPSELLKLAVVIFFAYYMSRIGDKMKTWKWGIWVPALFVMSIAVALFLQKHLSGLIIFLLLCVVMMFIGEAPFPLFGIAGGIGGAAIFFVLKYTDKAIDFLNRIKMSHAGERLMVWQDPNIDPLDKGHQIIQSLYAIGSGGVTGLGWAQSRQKYLYLPEPQNDYIFAILCEELGFVGAGFVILLFALLILRGFVIAYHAPNKFSSLVVMGIIIKVTIQFLLNIAVVTNILPATGIPLPFFSYGGTALIVLMAEMGIILSISKYSYQEKP